MPASPRILIHLDHNPHPRVFDQIMSLDGGADQILAHGDVDPQDVPVLVSGALYSRPRDELHRTALLITGTNDHVIDEMVRQARRAFFGPYRISLMSECKGGSTVAGATVARIRQLVPLIKARVVVVGGGPAGARTAGILAAEGARVLLTVFDEEEAGERAEFVAHTFDEEIETVVWKTGESLENVVEGARVVITAGPPGLTLLPRRVWSAINGLELLVDISGAEPAGIEGLSGEEDGDPVPNGGHNVLAFGGLAVSRYKIRVHRAAVEGLFQREAVVLGPLEIARLAREIITPSLD
ncbi:MAG TPA: methylene-tetrahydromethanopterin dehydrogenase N-terminal domain-containing protein [Gemmatimonadota bacterium]|nr:methylene-tetrahydromethanopterin dehydrogenase N-terminal domain-containing protein [Gemmatimonadota bacterium]